MRITKTYTVGGVKWYYITVNVGSYTYNGYVRSDMMTTISEAEYNKEGGDSDNSAGDQETIGMIKVTGNNVSLRYQPSTSANRVGTANIGDCFYYVDTVDGWFQTRSGYWISRSYAAVMTDEEVKAYIKNNGGSGNTGSNYTLGSTGSTVSYIQTALTALEYRLCLIFAQHRGQLLSRAQILDQLWDQGGNFVEDNTLTVYVKRLREKLAGAVTIETVRGRGYRVDQ